MLKSMQFLRLFALTLALCTAQAMAHSLRQAEQTADIVAPRTFFMRLRQEAKDAKAKYLASIIPTSVILFPTIIGIPFLEAASWELDFEYAARSRKGIKALQAAWTLNQTDWPLALQQDIVWSRKRFDMFYRQYVRSFPGTHPSAMLGKQELIDRLNHIARVLFALDDLRQRVTPSKVVTYLRNQVAQSLWLYAAEYPTISDRNLAIVWPHLMAALVRGAKNANAGSEVVERIEELVLPPTSIDEYLMMLDRINDILSIPGSDAIECDISPGLKKLLYPNGLSAPQSRPGYVQHG